MSAYHLVAGQRVHTTLGLATVVGFERFGCGIVKEYDTGGRVVCKLDKPETWLATAHTPNPYLFRSDILSDKENAGLL